MCRHFAVFESLMPFSFVQCPHCMCILAYFGISNLMFRGGKILALFWDFFFFFNRTILLHRKMFLWWSGSPNIYLPSFISLWKLFNYFKTYTFLVNMSHLKCQKFEYLNVCCIFSVYTTCLLSEWECVPPNVYC